MGTRLTVADIDQAIATIADSRRTHETWLIWYSQRPDEEAKHADTCGDSEWHRQCIAGYDHVLSVLQAARDLVGDFE